MSQDQDGSSGSASPHSLLKLLGAIAGLLVAFFTLIELVFGGVDSHGAAYVSRCLGKTFLVGLVLEYGRQLIYLNEGYWSPRLGLRCWLGAGIVVLIVWTGLIIWTWSCPHGQLLRLGLCGGGIGWSLIVIARQLEPRRERAAEEHRVELRHAGEVICANGFVVLLLTPLIELWQRLSEMFPAEVPKPSPRHGWATAAVAVFPTSIVLIASLTGIAQAISTIRDGGDDKDESTKVITIKSEPAPPFEGEEDSADSDEPPVYDCGARYDPGDELSDSQREAVMAVFHRVEGRAFDPAERLGAENVGCPGPPIAIDHLDDWYYVEGSCETEDRSIIIAPPNEDKAIVLFEQVADFAREKIASEEFTGATRRFDVPRDAGDAQVIHTVSGDFVAIRRDKTGGEDLDAVAKGICRPQTSIDGEYSFVVPGAIGPWTTLAGSVDGVFPVDETGARQTYTFTTASGTYTADCLSEVSCSMLIGGVEHAGAAEATITPEAVYIAALGELPPADLLTAPIGG